ncbi:hypothetical protein HK102_007072, partial [Quaeritorhiza haematococci]
MVLPNTSSTTTTSPSPTPSFGAAGAVTTTSTLQSSALSLSTSPSIQCQNMGKPIIAVDLDETISRTHEAIIKYHNEVFGTDHQPEDFGTYSYAE